MASMGALLWWWCGWAWGLKKYFDLVLTWPFDILSIVWYHKTLSNGQKNILKVQSSASTSNSLLPQCQKFKIIVRPGAVKEEMNFWIVNSCFCQKFKFSSPVAVTFQLHERFLSKVEASCLRSRKFEFFQINCGKGCFKWSGYYHQYQHGMVDQNPS